MEKISKDIVNIIGCHKPIPMHMISKCHPKVTGSLTPYEGRSRVNRSAKKQMDLGRFFKTLYSISPFTGQFF
jgi:hypothetical protein